MLQNDIGCKLTARECRLRIEGANTGSWVEIDRCGDDQYSWIEMSCAIDIGHGKFSARNVDLQFLNGQEFLAALDQFVLDHDLTPQLDGTYGTFLIFWRPGARNEVMLSFAIGDAFCSGPVTSEFNLTGSFLLPQDSLLDLVAEFRVMLVGMPQC